MADEVSMFVASSTYTIQGFGATIALSHSWQEPNSKADRNDAAVHI